ncbi:hypothetical protein BDZ89DRAFT_1038518 [Hymenopellis radicata]|nr:hypothetical protein BDZ89DRAFT_1038518 [Hymenopellis radicata]
MCFRRTNRHQESPFPRRSHRPYPPSQGSSTGHGQAAASVTLPVGNNQRQLQLLANEPRQDRVDALLRQLSNANSQEVMLHLNRQQKAMVSWFRPHRSCMNGTMTQLGARSLQQQSVQRPEIRPICIHGLNPVLYDDECRMDLHLHQRVDGLDGYHDIFQCPLSHRPRYYMILPLVRPSVIVHTEEELQDHLSMYGPEESEEKSIEEEDLRLHLEREEDLRMDPRIVRPGELGARPHSFEDSTAPRTRNKAHHICIYPEIAAIQRSISAVANIFLDIELIKNLQERYKENIHRLEIMLSHPAFTLQGPSHALLEPYDGKMHPGVEAIPWEYLDFFHLATGVALRDLNTSLGLPPQTFDRIRAANVVCKACKCAFSSEGYHGHIEHGSCTNWPVFMHEELVLRTFPDGLRGDQIQADEFLDHPIGLAMMSWNSRLGVPQDVWHLIFTACIQCPTCRLVRSPSAYVAHLESGVGSACKDVGEQGAQLAKKFPSFPIQVLHKPALNKASFVGRNFAYSTSQQSQLRGDERDSATVEAMLLAGPREEEGPLSRPKPRPRRMGYQGFFAMEDALDRARPDIQYVQLVINCYATGVFQAAVNPQSHPLYGPTLSPYMARYGRPLGMNCALQHLQFFDSNFGQFFSDLDSEIGVPPAAFLLATRAAVTCDVCLCVFSPPGFLAHAPDGECKNWVVSNRGTFPTVFNSAVLTPTKCTVNQMLLIRSKGDLDLFVPLRAIRLSEIDEAVGEGAEGGEYKAPALEETAIKAAFIEWNSRVGVTQNVWALLSTSDVRCTGCSLLRTWYGHLAHFKKGDTCPVAQK